MKILVPLKVPFFPDVAKVGIRLAKAVGAELSFLNVADTRPMRGYVKFPERVIEGLRKGGEEVLKEAMALAKKEGVKAESTVVEGYPDEEILKASEGVDLIVLGIRRFSPEGAIGSVMQKVLGSSTKPILVVEREQEKFDNILVAIDGSEYSKKALEYSIDYAKILGLSSISAIFVARSPDKVGVGKEVLKEASDVGEKSKVKVNTYLEEGDPAKKILKFSDEKGFNVVIMGATGKGTMSRFFLGSVSRKVAAFSCCAVIIAPHRE